MKKSASKFRAFFAHWGRDLVPAAIGAGLGFAVALIVVGMRDESSAPPPPATKPPAPQASIPSPKPQPETAPRSIALPPQMETPPRPAPAPPAARARDEHIPAWQRFAVASAPAAGRAMVAVVIDDMGIDRRRSEIATRLPAPLTLSFLTYARDLPQQTAAARARGHELMLHVPMEPESNGPDPGPNVLRTGLEPAELDRRIDWALSRFEGFVGINNHMGSRFTRDPQAMARVMAALDRRGLLWLDSRTTPQSVGPRAARERHVPYAERSVFLDNENGSSEVRARLAQLERLARQTGYAIAIGHPRDATLSGLAAWLPTLHERGLALVPVSAIVRHRLETQRRTAGAP